MTPKPARIAGLLTLAQAAAFTVTVIDSSSPTQQAASSVLSITVH